MKKIVLIVLLILAASSSGTSAWPSEREEELISATFKLTDKDTDILVKEIVQVHKTLFVNEKQFAVLCLVPRKYYSYEQLDKFGLCAYSRPNGKDANQHAEQIVLQSLQNIKKAFNGMKMDGLLYKNEEYAVLIYTYLIPCGGCKDSIAFLWNRTSYGDVGGIHVVYTELYPRDNYNAANRNYEKVLQIFNQNDIILSRFPRDRL
eukprot:Em0003g985a